MAHLIIDRLRFEISFQIWSNQIDLVNLIAIHDLQVVFIDILHDKRNYKAMIAMQTSKTSTDGIS